ncbi:MULTISPECIES: hypothetical protein [Bacillus]|uniref:hypothetical protein n=1 Tax=Bacillus TaxID=1386 RepID=UPI0018CF2E27|nr:MULTISPECIES: hypothetical protein [Bacillus]MBG9464217.1 hypothetical protein [Bacillus amyloliquefaciens]MDU0074972.1 hypothetical protein [Bacillus sp. IG2]MDU0100682.1 hypothetical protein [Bacillus sp. IS1]MED3680831.1 hypothetical protein [Bacillus velezensis]
MATKETVIESNEVVTEKEAPKKKTVKKKKQINRNQLVSCFNVTSGSLKYISKKTGLETVWSAYGDEEYIEVSELLTMKSSQPKFLTEPWIFIDDEEVVQYLGLSKVYQHIIPIDEVEEFFNLSATDAKDILPKLPRGMKELIADKARKGVESGEFNNLQLLKLLEKELHLDILSLAD